MTFELPPLPYAKNALEPYISEETLTYHHGKHHQAYVNKLNALVPNTEFADLSLEGIIRKASGGIFNNAAQVWNHTFYWHCMTPNGSGEPTEEVASAIDHAFGSFSAFKAQFTKAAATHFGSGWAWLVKSNNGSLEVMSTSNAENPLTQNKTPLLTCDVWEHAYYIDTRNDRPKYIDNFWHLVNWDAVTDNLTA